MHLLSKKHDKRLACVFTGVERGGHEVFLKIAQEPGLTEAVQLLGYVEKRDMPLRRTARETLKVLEEAASIGAQPRRRLS